MARKPGANVPKARKKSGSVPTATGRQVDWMLIGAVVVVIGLLAGLAIYLVPKFNEKRANERDDVAVQSAAEFVPSPQTPDPSNGIEGVTKIYYQAGKHVNASQRVAYDQSPPFGGPHDEIWATCTGVVYPNPLRSENAVHALEHGAVWITYNPDTASPEDVDYLKRLVRGEQYLFLSPYPGLDKPVSLQSWGHQLKLDSATDPRVDQFITSLRRNMMPSVYPENPQTAAYPETQATCTAIPGFDPSNPPPADEGAPGPDAVPMDGGGNNPMPAG